MLAEMLANKINLGVVIPDLMLSVITAFHILNFFKLLEVEWILFHLINCILPW